MSYVSTTVPTCTDRTEVAPKITPSAKGRDTKRRVCRALGPGPSLNGKQFDVVVGEASVDRDEREPI